VDTGDGVAGVSMGAALTGRERSDRAAVKDALTRVRRDTGLPVAFLGRVDGRVLRLSEFEGVRTQGLTGLEVVKGAGLGGRVVQEGRGATVEDYGEARGISHHYDVQVLGEGLRSMVAVPVTWEDRPRAVLYAATRSRLSLGERVRSVVEAVSRRLSIEFAVQDEVERRLAMVEAADSRTATDPYLSGPEREELRAVHAELRSLIPEIGDETIAARLEKACTRLAGRPSSPNAGPTLAPREIDVLALVALGCTNVETGRRLGLTAETVKGYLRNAMRRLDVATRHEAVVRARALGQLP
jgi:DNA-binding CsgD family transcriptional regulator